MLYTISPLLLPFLTLFLADGVRHVRVEESKSTDPVWCTQTITMTAKGIDEDGEEIEEVTELDPDFINTFGGAVLWSQYADGARGAKPTVYYLGCDFIHHVPAIYFETEGKQELMNMIKFETGHETFTLHVPEGNSAEFSWRTLIIETRQGFCQQNLEPPGLRDCHGAVFGPWRLLPFKR